MALTIDWTKCPNLPPQLTPEQQGLVNVVGFGMAITLVSRITEKDLLEIATRFAIAQRVGGNFGQTSSKQSIPVTIEHLKMCMGLSINGPFKPRSTFLAQVFRATRDELQREEEQAKRAATTTQSKILTPFGIERDN